MASRAFAVSAVPVVVSAGAFVVAARASVATVEVAAVVSAEFPVAGGHRRRAVVVSAAPVLMLLLDALPLLVLLLPEPIKLLLMFVLESGIGGCRVRCPQRRRTVRIDASVTRRWIPRLVSTLGILGRTVRTGGSPRFHCAMRFESARANAGSNVGPAVVHRSQQSPI